LKKYSESLTTWDEEQRRRMEGGMEQKFWHEPHWTRDHTIIHFFVESLSSTYPPSFPVPPLPSPLSVSALSVSLSLLHRVTLQLDSLYVTKRSRALNLHGHLLDSRKKIAPNLWRKQTQIFWSRALARHASSSSSSRTIHPCALLVCVFSGDQGRTCQFTNARTVSSWMKSWGRASWMTVFFNPRWLLMAPSWMRFSGVIHEWEFSIHDGSQWLIVIRLPSSPYMHAS
jgi:hypothetical protein